MHTWDLLDGASGGIQLINKRLHIGRRKAGSIVGCIIDKCSHRTRQVTGPRR